MYLRSSATSRNLLNLVPIKFGKKREDKRKMKERSNLDNSNEKKEGIKGEKFENEVQFDYLLSLKSLS